MNVVCPLCNSTNTNLIMDTVRFDRKADVHICNDCTLTFINQDTLSLPEDFYEKEYHQTYLTHVEPDALDPDKYYQKMLKATKPWVNRFKEIAKSDDVVLDVGCSTGHFITSIQDSVKKVYGHELSISEVEYCQNKLGLNVSNVPLKERFEPETFDYITMIFVLEHIAEPKQFLNDLSTYLKPDGKFVILVPNIQDALVNFYDIPNFRKFYYCVEHLFYYSQKTMKYLFDQVGLKGDIELVQEYPITNHLNWAYREAPQDTLKARADVPNAKLCDESLMPEWEDLWQQMNGMYTSFLKKHGYGDRVWAVAGKQ